MSAVGLFYVGAVLFINGLMLLGRISPKSAGIFNVFVGALQCTIPIILLSQAGDDPAVFHANFAILLFGFTYLYVGISNLTGISGEGIGWFSLFVAGSAVYMGFDSFTAGDLTFGVIWLAWAVLWTLFFLLLALDKAELTTFTGWLVTLWSIPTCSVPAALLMRDIWEPGRSGAATALVTLGLLAAAATIMTRRSTTTNTHRAAVDVDELSSQTA